MNRVKYRKDFPEKLLVHMTKGKCFMSFGKVAGCGPTILYEWIKKYPKFKAAHDAGQSARISALEDLAMIKISGQDVAKFDHKKSDTYLLSMLLKTAAPKEFSEKTEVDHKSSDGSMSPTNTAVIIIPSNSREKK